jgi:hypothetical protein
VLGGANESGSLYAVKGASAIDELDAQRWFDATERTVTGRLAVHLDRPLLRDHDVRRRAERVPMSGRSGASTASLAGSSG